MKINVDKDNNKASLVFTDKEIEILKNNNNSFTMKGEDLSHFKNNLMGVIFELAKISPNITSQGGEEISQEEVPKK
tara:strand:+ start:340 stop:567 length:228 start_codon:yes stop_codon:yes gene_type:complete